MSLTKKVKQYEREIVFMKKIPNMIRFFVKPRNELTSFFWEIEGA